MRIRRGLHNYLDYQTRIDKHIPGFIKKISVPKSNENGLFSKIDYIEFNKRADYLKIKLSNNNFV